MQKQYLQSIYVSQSADLVTSLGKHAHGKAHIWVLKRARIIGVRIDDCDRSATERLVCNEMYSFLCREL